MKDEDAKIVESEFGRGLVYCLGLFLAHADRLDYLIDKYSEYSAPETAKAMGVPDPKVLALQMWIDGASDHLKELMYEEAPTDELVQRCKDLRDKCFKMRGAGFTTKGTITEEEARTAIQEAKDILRLIDRAYLIDAVKGSWE